MWRWLWRWFSGFAAVVVTGGLASAPAAPSPFFSIDGATSPSASVVSNSAVLAPGPVGGPPDVVADPASLGLVGGGVDELDALSVSARPDEIYFSVAPGATGTVGDVSSEAAAGQAAGDVYTSWGTGFNRLAFNQDVLGELPATPPGTPSLLARDDLDALDFGAPIPDVISLANGHPYLGLEVGCGGDLFAPGLVLLFDYFSLGLASCSDDIDAVHVDFATGSVYFSLAPGSPSLQPGSPIAGCFAGCSAADIFFVPFGLPNASVFLTAAQLGLAPTDDVKALALREYSGDVYTDLASWEAALGAPVAREDFESAPLGALSLGTTDVGQVDLTLSGDVPFGNSIIEPGNVNGTRELAGTVTENSGQVRRITIEFPTPVRGVALELFSAVSGNGLRIDTGLDVYELGAIGVSTGFVGIVEPVSFSSITLTSPFENFWLDDLRFERRDEQVTTVRLYNDPPSAADGCLDGGPGLVNLVFDGSICGTNVICSGVVDIPVGGTVESNAALARSVLQPACGPAGISVGGSGPDVVLSSVGLPFDFCVDALKLEPGPFPVCDLDGGTQLAAIVPTRAVPALSAPGLAALVATLAGSGLAAAGWRRRGGAPRGGGERTGA